MAQVVATINLKGGVGKTHTTVAIAEVLSAYRKKRVLVIDLDPQTNATTMLIGEKKWQKLNQNGYTLAQLFKDALDPDNAKFDLSKTLQKNVSDVREASTIDLLPSSLDLIDVQDRLATIPAGKFFEANPIAILHRAVKSILDDYDLVLVDCPPNLGIITLNGLRISNGYIIPTIPDILSTYGIPQIVKRIGEFSDKIAESIEPLGVVISKYRAQSTVHQNTTKLLRQEKDAPCFDTVIPESNSISGAAETVAGDRTIKQKYGYKGEPETYLALADELWGKL
ncbi:AAA family ATPase [Rhizobium laguerreae]|nr:AAA family ATPase [Rhizobium laguerreae]MBY3286538.1 AAA family ATPase [Rhizobium laguerreae]MBY3293201.1 AAA family ATPase [Rhizobium laguerreae]